MEVIKITKFLDVSLEYMMNLPNTLKVTVYYSDAIIDVKGGWCKVYGKIYYNDTDFDYWKIRCYRKKQAKEYYRKLLSKFNNGL